MKLAYASDLHLEFRMIELENTENADVLVLAGDIVVADRLQPKHEWFFENCANEFKDVVYVMGNHEFYHGDFKETPKILRGVLSQFPNFHFLDNDVWEKDGVRFFGSTFWTDMNQRDPYILDYVSRCMNDFRLVKNGDVRFTTSDAAREHSKAIGSLMFALAEDKDKPYVVVSHHAPSKQSIHPRYQNESEMNYGYHSDLESLMVENPRIKLWFHGHTHTPFDYKVGETRVLCNPRGYVGEEERANKFKLQYVEV